jgi:threonine/homoserine/homoserine lactone efflux protein
MFLTPDQFLAFLAAAVLITVAPGPDNLMVLGFGMSRGRAAGIAFGLGCGFGCLSHTLLAAAGVSALIAASPPAFLALKVGGGLYLVWLGCKAWQSRGGARAAVVEGGGEPLSRLFAKGLLANAINPKVVLFFLSFLPQFVAVERGNIGWQTAQLGFVFTAQAALLFGLLGLFSGSVGLLLQRRARAGVWLDRLAGTIFVALGVRMIALR